MIVVDVVAVVIVVGFDARRGSGARWNRTGSRRLMRRMKRRSLGSETGSWRACRGVWEALTACLVKRDGMGEEVVEDVGRAGRRFWRGTFGGLGGA